MSELKESAEYENFLGKKEEIEDDKLPLDIEVVDDGREELWVGMPEFVQKDKKAYKTIYLHFRSEEDFLEFCSKYKSVDGDQLITKKTKSMWYPHLDKDANTLKRWIEGND